mmetsp:Transcript_8448/g.13300  ORF Transcript_8448/g.13300 Transcript_8448/m.13300 type:complete len:216 (-) Transcript_8448:1894-2541(-)
MALQRRAHEGDRLRGGEEEGDGGGQGGGKARAARRQPQTLARGGGGGPARAHHGGPAPESGCRAGDIQPQESHRAGCACHRGRCTCRRRQRQQPTRLLQGVRQGGGGLRRHHSSPGRARPPGVPLARGGAVRAPDEPRKTRGPPAQQDRPRAQGERPGVAQVLSRGDAVRGVQVRHGTWGWRGRKRRQAGRARAAHQGWIRGLRRIGWRDAAPAA